MTYTETTRREKKARKDHDCRECGQPITKGTVYMRNSELIDGKYNSLTRHIDCIEAGDILDAELSGTEKPRLFLKPLLKENPQLEPRLIELLGHLPDVIERLNVTA